MARANGVIFGQRLLFVAVYEACTDVDEMRRMIQPAIHLKQAHGAGDVELHEFELRAAGRPHAAGRAMNNEFRTYPLEDLGRIDHIVQIVFDEADLIGQICDGGGVDIPHQRGYVVSRIAREPPQRVVAEGAIASCEQNPLPGHRIFAHRVRTAFL